MAVEHILILLLTGSVAGFAAGLLGIGGGFFMTPVQYIVYTAMGIVPDVAIKMAFGTSLMAILPTAVSGALRHSRRGMVWWRPAIIMGVFSLLGGFVGATLAVHLPGAVLKIAFGAVALAASLRMLVSRQTQVEPAPRENIWLWIGCALPVGVLTGILGIGGGVVMVPLMVLALRFGMHRTVATSLAMMIFTSTGGAVGYIINGLGVPGLPAWSLGYVNLPSWFLLAVSSVGMAQVGAITAHRLPAGQLRYIFVAILLYVGLRMIGVFEWLGWPL